MLQNLEQILKSQEGQLFDESDFQNAASTLLQKQFIWSDGHGQKKVFDLVIGFFDYFDTLFDAIGFSLVRDYKYGYCGIIPNSGVPTMKKLDTLLLLLIAKMHDEQCRKACSERGRTTPCLGSLLDLYVQMTGQEKPLRTDVLESIKRIARHGVVLLGEHDEQLNLPKITVLPSISQVVTLDFIESIHAFAPQNVMVDETNETAEIDTQKAQDELIGENHG